MMVVNVTFLILAFLWGAFLGLFYFGGLWLTLKTVFSKHRPQHWLAASFFARVAVALAGFWVLLRMDPVSFFCTLAGFFLVRIVLTRAIGHKNRGSRHAAHA
jgi:F1F0 ATPase subunit 2